MTRRPDLFIIGAAKCGTTSLYNYLKGHPEIYMSPRKEPRYFSPDLMRATAGKKLRYGEDLDRYLALFADARDEKRLGEATARYIYSRAAPRLIHDFDPNAYIVAMIRNPVDMTFSLHGNRVADGTEDIADFEAALAAEADRLEGRRLPDDAVPAMSQYRPRARFGEQLPRWFDTFGRDRVHVIVFEDMVRDPSPVFRRLLEFLEVDASYEPASFDTHNPRHAARSKTVRALLTSSAPQWLAWRLLPRLVGDRAARQIVGPFRKLNRKSAPRPKMSPELRRLLEQEFEPDVARTSELLGRDLAALWFGRPAGTSKAKGEAVMAR